MMRLAATLIGLSRRERLLVLLMVLLAVPAALWLAVAEPLLASRDAARTAVAEAEDLRAWVVARRAELAALPNPEANDSATAPVGLAGIEARLQSAGLTPAGTGGAVQLGDAGQDGVSLRFERVDFALLMDWLTGVEAEAGYRVATLTLAAGDIPGQVGADLRLEPAS
jgi:type II secretory pathway component PulM